MEENLIKITPNKEKANSILKMVSSRPLGRGVSFSLPLCLKAIIAN